MNRPVFIALLIIVVASTLNSCASSLRSPQALYIHSISVEPPTRQRIWKSDFYFYDSNGEWVQDKTISRNEDSVAENISISLTGFEQGSYSFLASWYVTHRNPDMIRRIRHPGIPNNVYSQNTKDSTVPLITVENFSFYVEYTDTTDKLSYVFEHDSEDGNTTVNEVTISHEGDSVSYERVLEISPEIIDFFRQMTFKYGDSIDLITAPRLPGLSNCSLKKSNYKFIESCNNPLGNKKEIYIDSTFVDGNFEVQRNEEFYFLFEEKGPEGGYKFKKYTTNHYIEQHFLPNEVGPCYELKYDISSNGRDTTSTSELTVSRDGRLGCYKIVQTGHLSKKSGPTDLRLPIVKREMYFWIDPRKQSIVRKRYVAYTEQDHRLEKEWLTSNNYKIIRLLDTVPRVSGNQKYDIVPREPHEPQYPYFNSLSNQKHKSSSKFRDRQKKQLIKRLRKRTTELEKDRSTGYEKRISQDFSEVYEIYYFKKK